MSPTMSSGVTNTNNERVAALAQLCSTSNKLQNLMDVAVCARLAKAQGASMLFLPECFGFLGENSAQTLEQAEDPILQDNNNKNEEIVTKFLLSTLAGEVTPTTPSSTKILDGKRIHLLDGLKTVARESGLWISGGGMHVLGAPDDDQTGNKRIYNTHLILDNEGHIQAIYRKIHLFDVSIPGKVQLRESATTAPGETLIVCDSPIGKLGLSTCYDVRFPEMYIPLVQNGAQILLMPSAFTVPTGAAHWHTLLKARAIESQCYVLAAAQYGKHNTKRESFGHSLAVDPWGKIVADAGGYPFDGSDDVSLPPKPPSIVTCKIGLDLIDSVRLRMPIEMHRSSANFSF